MGLTEDLGRGRVGVDTAVFIYWIEEHPQFLQIIDPLFQEVDAGRREVVTSALTLLELLVAPYRAGDLESASRYERLLTRSRGLSLVDISREQLRDAAKLRAAFAVRASDALQLAAALGTGCTAFLTNGRRLPRIAGIEVVQLADYID
ncbi:MAG: type II toxin-antitoxin system VapC family toxin [Steroidobacteraceae bacterium]